MYLFEKILLCCKELGPKQMAKIKYRAVQPTDKKGRPRMALKGRIFMQNVTDVVYLSRVGMSVSSFADKTRPNTRQAPTASKYTGEATRRSNISLSVVQRKTWGKSGSHKSTFNGRSVKSNYAAPPENRFRKLSLPTCEIRVPWKILTEVRMLKMGRNTRVS